MGFARTVRRAVVCDRWAQRTRTLHSRGGTSNSFQTIRLPDPTRHAVQVPDDPRNTHQIEHVVGQVDRGQKRRRFKRGMLLRHEFAWRGNRCRSRSDHPQRPHHRQLCRRIGPRSLGDDMRAAATESRSRHAHSATLVVDGRGRPLNAALFSAAITSPIRTHTNCTFVLASRDV